MMFLSILINAAVQAKNNTPPCKREEKKPQTDLKWEHEAENQTVWKNTGTGNKAAVHW